jgi:RNA polymerase sigma-70 factor (ECF subfamily)
VLEKDYLQAVDRTKGKFRSFLLAMLRHFIANHRRDARAQKRGGRVSFISIEDESLDEKHLNSSFADASAEQSFERQWALTLLDQVVTRLREEYRSTNKAALFEELKDFSNGNKHAESYGEMADAAHDHGSRLENGGQPNAPALRRAASCGDSKTRCSTREEADEEMRALFAALG